MEFSINDIISIIGLLLGGGSLGGFFTWRYVRRIKEAEAEQSEAAAAKEVQDVYQQLIADVKVDRDEQKSYIQELKEDRRHLRDERDELRQRQDKLEAEVRGLQLQVVHNSKMVEAMRPLMCGVDGCALRQPIAVSVDGDFKPVRIMAQQTSSIEPINHDDL